MDLTFRTEHGRFNYRVGAIIMQDGRLLMVRNEDTPYLYSVGGRVKLNETAEEAVIREVYEETGAILEVDRLGYVHENFFIEETTKERFHEISFFYFMKPADIQTLTCTSVNERETKEELVWIPLSDLDRYYLFPDFFKSKLIDPSDRIEHCVTKEV